MNKAKKLFDSDYIRNYFIENILPLYPQFSDIKKVKIIPHKKMIWEELAYHVVCEYEVSFVEIIDDIKKIKKLPIFCSAHSHEKRYNVYEALHYLWEKGFGQGYRTIPRPMYFSQNFNAVFYRGVKGNNLYHYIKEHDFKAIEEVAAKTAKWFVKLHSLDTSDAKNFNPENSRILSILPGKKHVLEAIKNEEPHYLDLYEKAYDYFIKYEDEFLQNTDKLFLVHGDAHPENIIKMGAKKIAVIDFTDLCLGDFARDIGTFLQQISYMVGRKISDSDYALKLQHIFLDNYFDNAKIKLDENLKKRISNYYHFTALRTATFLLMGTHYHPDRAKNLLEELNSSYFDLIKVFK
ncbi:MAG: phosphotransferase family protein [Parcubacteria group bacterium]